MLEETTEILWLMPVTIGIVVFVPASLQSIMAQAQKLEESCFKTPF